MLKIIKKIIPFVLLISIFLPMSQCTVHPHYFNKLKAAKTTVYYATSGNDPAEIAINVFALAWPFLFFLLLLRVKTLDRKIYFKVIEMLLCLATAFVLFLATLFNQVLYGGVIVLMSVMAYFFITLYELYRIIRDRLET